MDPNLRLPAELRHVYRALLRAATYLPDSASRTFVHGRIKERFRAVSYRIKGQDWHLKQALIARYHGREHIQKTKQEAAQLERAGLGSRPDLRRVLLQTYGRIGPRRYALVHDLLGHEEDNTSDNESVERHITDQQTPIPKDDNGLGTGPMPGQKYKDLPPEIPPQSKIGTFLRSQMHYQPDSQLMPIRKIRRLEAQIPAEGIWGRPLPVRRQISMKREHWANLLDNLLPPVPGHEWNRLRDFATGTIPVEEPPARRSRPSIEEVLEGEQNIHSLFKYFTTPVDMRRKQRLDSDEVRVDAEHGATYISKPPTVKPFRDSMKGTMSSRYMRRLYASIWALTPTMSQNEEDKRWTVRWGAGRSAFFAGEITAPSTKDMGLFEGAEKAGGKKGVKLRGRRGREVLGEANEVEGAIDPVARKQRVVYYNRGVIAAV